MNDPRVWALLVYAALLLVAGIYFAVRYWRVVAVVGALACIARAGMWGYHIISPRVLVFQPEVTAYVDAIEGNCGDAEFNWRPAEEATAKWMRVFNPAGLGVTLTGQNQQFSINGSTCHWTVSANVPDHDIRKTKR